MTNPMTTSQESWREEFEVKIAEPGTPLAIFQKERTDAISGMFDNVNEYGIYPTGKFFARLDNCVASLLASVEAETRARTLKEAEETIGKESIDADDSIVGISGRHAVDIHNVAVRNCVDSLMSPISFPQVRHPRLAIIKSGSTPKPSHHQ